MFSDNFRVFQPGPARRTLVGPRKDDYVFIMSATVIRFPKRNHRPAPAFDPSIGSPAPLSTGAFATTLLRVQTEYGEEALYVGVLSQPVWTDAMTGETLWRMLCDDGALRPVLTDAEVRAGDRVEALGPYVQVPVDGQTLRARSLVRQAADRWCVSPATRVWTLDGDPVPTYA